MRRYFLTALAGVFSVSTLWAAYVQVVFPSTNLPVNVGEWHKSYDAVFAKGNTENIPVVALLGSTFCSICSTFDKELTNRTFTAWQKSSGLLFLYGKVYNGDWSEYNVAQLFKLVGSGAIPRGVVYWKKADGTTVKQIFEAQHWTAQQFINYITGLVGTYVPPAPLDASDPNDDAYSGTAVSNLTAATTTTWTTARSLSGTDTNDWFKATLQAGKQYQLSAKNVSVNNAAPTVSVFSSTGGVPVSPAVATAALTSLTSGLMLNPAASGTYYVRVTRAPNTTATVSYTLGLRELQACQVSFAALPSEIEEDAGKIALTLNRSGRETDAVAVTVTTSNGTATAGTNYTAVNKSYAFAIGETSKTVEIAVKDIAGPNGDRTFNVALASADVQITLGAAKTVTIKDVDKSFDDADGAAGVVDGDDLATGATFLTTLPEPQVTADHYLSTQDTNDWFCITGVVSGKTYQVGVTVAEARPAGTVSADVAFYYGSAAPAFMQRTASSLLAAAYRFTATNTGSVYMKVSAPAVAGSNFRYRLSYREWVLPVVSFTSGTVSVAANAATAKSLNLALVRTQNADEAVTVYLNTADGTALAGTDYTALANQPAAFAAGVTNGTKDVQILPDGGVWSPDRQFTVTIAESAGVIQAAGQHSATVTVASSRPMADASDGSGATDGNAAKETATLLTMAKQRQSIEASLNGTDTNDWYAFEVQAGVEYFLKLASLYTNATGLAASVILPGETAETPVTLDTLAAGYHLTPAAAGTLWLRFSRTADVAACVLYTLDYREWVPAVVSFTVSQVTVSEYVQQVELSVVCTMEVPMEVSARITTQDGSATAGDDYVAQDVPLLWTDADPTYSVKKVTIPLLNKNVLYEGTELFTVKLDSADAVIEADTITNVTVRLTEKDVGKIGSFAIAGFQLDGSATFVPYTTLAASIPDGQKMTVTVKRLYGNAGVVTNLLKWSDNSATYPVVFEEFQTERTVEVTAPASEGVYKARQYLSLTLSTATRGASVTSANALRYWITDRDAALTSYVADRTKVPFSSSSQAWYVSGTGTVDEVVRSKVLALNATAAMSVTLAGSGTLSFEGVSDGAGTLTCAGGGNTATFALSSGVPTNMVYAVGTGNRTVTITFKAGSANASVALRNIQWTPGADVLSKGTFNGVAEDATYGNGLLRVSVSATGWMTGKIQFPAKTFTFTVAGFAGNGVETDGVKTNLTSAFTAVSGTTRMENLVLQLVTDTRSSRSVLSIEGGTLSAVAYRNAWADRPLTGDTASVKGIAENYYTAVLPGYAASTFVPEAACGSSFLTMTVSKSGVVNGSGVLADGTAISFSSTVVVPEAGQGQVYILAAPTTYKGGYVFLTLVLTAKEDGTYAIEAATSGGAWISQAATTGFTRVLRNLSGGYYSKTSSLSDYYLGLDLSVKQSEPDSAPEYRYTQWNGSATAAVETNATVWAASEGSALGTLALNRYGVGSFSGQNASAMTYALTKATGLFTGRFAALFDVQTTAGGTVNTVKRTVTYKGAMVPGRFDRESDSIEGAGYYLATQYDGPTATVKSYEILIQQQRY
ncbi:MAG TPA: Calx-beta domain-containing protein [Kiritimatiellia bacterium]|nr:Calx-beta domain-containing protein [Kiritimatiellia bacterium]HPS06401.1 Calx-beta domain-containing protein [Kiritimatiellia bacterium]